MSNYDVELNAITKSKIRHDIFMPFNMNDCKNPDGTPKEMLLGSFNSSHLHEDVPMFWHTTSRQPLTSSSAGPGKVNYKSPGGSDHIESSYQVLEVPGCRVEEEYVDKYRICWTDFLGYSIVEDSNIQVNGNSNDVLTSIDRYTLIFDLYRNCIPHVRDAIAYKAGHKKKLIEWSEELHADILTPQQISYQYDMGSEHSVPIYKIQNYQENFVHQYNLKLQVSDHLRMMKFVDDKWVELKKDKIEFEVLEGITSKTKFNEPSMWGVFDNCTDPEKKIIYDRTSTYYVDSNIKANGDNDADYGTNISSSFSGPHMTKVVYWGAENCSARDRNNHFNFTADLCQTDESESAILHHTLGKGGTYRFNNLETYHLVDGPMDVSRYDCRPMKNGTFAEAFPTKASRPGSNVANILDGYKLECQLVEANGRVADKFRLITRQHIFREIKIDQGKVIINKEIG